MKIDFYYSLSLEKCLALCNVIIFIKSVFNNEKNRYYYNRVLEKYLNK